MPHDCLSCCTAAASLPGPSRIVGTRERERYLAPLLYQPLGLCTPKCLLITWPACCHGSLFTGLCLWWAASILNLLGFLCGSFFPPPKALTAIWAELLWASNSTFWLVFRIHRNVHWPDWKLEMEEGSSSIQVFLLLKPQADWLDNRIKTMAKKKKTTFLGFIVLYSRTARK